MTPLDSEQSGTWTQRHRVLTTILALIAVLAWLGSMGAALGFGPLQTTGDRLDAIEPRIMALDSLRMLDRRATILESQMNLVQADHARYSEIVTVIIPLLFCRDATQRERSLARGIVDCTGVR